MIDTVRLNSSVGKLCIWEYASYPLREPQIPGALALNDLTYLLCFSQDEKRAIFGNLWDRLKNIPSTFPLK